MSWMSITRLTETIELNNALLLGGAVAIIVVATWLVLAAASVLIRQAIRATQIKALQSIADGLSSQARLALVIVSLVSAVAGAGVLAYAMWKEIDLEPTVERLLAALTVEVIPALGRSAGLLLLLLLGLHVLKRVGRRWLGKVERRLTGPMGSERAHLDRFLAHLPGSVSLALAYALLVMVSAELRMPAAAEWLITTIIYVLLVASVGRTLVYLAHYLSERQLRRSEQKSQGTRLEEYYAALRRVLPVGQRSMEAIIYVSAATLIVRRFETLESFAPYGPLLIRIISLFFAASVVVELSRILIARLLPRAAADTTEDAGRRRQTFVSIIQGLIKYAIYFCVSMMVLSDIGVDPTPILAGAGIVGLTVGLGAQKIVQDMVNGLFLLFEDQILQGDYVRVDDTEGVVEQLSLRITRIRDRYGRLHLLRNGEIQNVINYSRGWTLAVVDMSVAYESDLARALEVMQEVTAELPEQLPDAVTSPPEIKGIEAIDESCLRVRIETRVAPGRHFEVKRALHRLLVDGFNANGLEIPYPKAVEIGIEPQPAGGQPRPSRP